MRHRTATAVIVASVAYLIWTLIDRDTAVSVALLYVALVVTLLKIGQSHG